MSQHDQRSAHRTRTRSHQNQKPGWQRQGREEMSSGTDLRHVRTAYSGRGDIYPVGAGASALPVSGALLT